MPLYETGKSKKTLSGTNYEAKDQNDKLATVSITVEADQDYEFNDCWNVASKKYDRGDFELKGNRPFVTVKTDDFKSVT